MNLDALAQYSQWAGALVFLIVIVWLFRKFLAPAVESYEASRNAEIAESEARRQRLRSDVSVARAGIEQADNDAAAILARANDFARHERERIIAEAESDAKHVVRNGEGELGRARIAARSHLRDEFVRLALQAARTQAAARVDDATNSRLVTRAVDALATGRG